MIFVRSSRTKPVDVSEFAQLRKRGPLPEEALQALELSFEQRPRSARPPFEDNPTQIRIIPELTEPTESMKRKMVLLAHSWGWGCDRFDDTEKELLMRASVAAVQYDAGMPTLNVPTKSQFNHWSNTTHNVLDDAIAKEIEEQISDSDTNPKDNKRDVEYKGTVVGRLPRHLVVVSKRELSRLRHCESVYSNLKALLKWGRYNGNRELNHWISVSVAQLPRTSCFALEQFFAPFLYGICRFVGLEVTPENCCWSPSGKKLRKIVREGGACRLVLLQQELNRVTSVYLLCDKAENKSHFVKCLAFYSNEHQRVVVRMIDVDCTGYSSAEAASSIRLAIDQKLTPSDHGSSAPAVQFSGQTTDSGGGGTLEKLHQELEKLDLCNGEERNYLVAACTLHVLSLANKNAMEVLSGPGGIGNLNLMQFLHCLWDLQESFTRDEWLEYALMVTNAMDGRQIKKLIPKPLLTRWWWVGKVLKEVTHHWKEWDCIATTALQQFGASSRRGKIAAQVQALSRQPMIRIQAHFVAAFDRCFFNKHFKWLQGADKHSGAPGFRSRSMAERYYIMDRDLRTLTENWKTEDAFDTTVVLLDKLKANEESMGNAPAQLDESTQRVETPTVKMVEDSICAFLRSFKDSMQKHLDLWINSNLFMCALAGEKQCVRALSCWLHNVKDDDVPEVSFESETHGGECINTKDYIHWIQERGGTKDTLEQTELALKHPVGLQMMTLSNEDMWTSNEPLIAAIADFARERILPLASNTHIAENMVRVVDLCATTNRPEEEVSAVALTYFTDDREVNARTLEKKSGRELRGNQYVEPGHVGQRARRSETEDDDEDNEYEPKPPFDEKAGRASRGSFRALEVLKYGEKIFKATGLQNGLGLQLMLARRHS